MSPRGEFGPGAVV